MNKILKKALVLCTIVLLAATNSLTSLAQSNVYSPEFPDAYIETSNIMTRADGDTTVTATVYVKEVQSILEHQKLKNS